MKLLLENWRKYIKEVDDVTMPAKKGAKAKTPEQEKGLEYQKQLEKFSLPAELLPTLYKVFIGDVETFSLIHNKYDLKSLENKEFEEIKHDRKYGELIQQMLYEPIKTLDAIGHYGKVKKEHYKDFFDFVYKLPEEERVHVLTALAIYSDKWTRADIVGLLSFAREQLEIYGCLFHKGMGQGWKISSDDYRTCRGQE